MNSGRNYDPRYNAKFHVSKQSDAERRAWATPLENLLRPRRTHPEVLSATPDADAPPVPGPTQNSKHLTATPPAQSTRPISPAGCTPSSASAKQGRERRESRQVRPKALRRTRKNHTGAQFQTGRPVESFPSYPSIQPSHRFDATAEARTRRTVFAVHPVMRRPHRDVEVPPSPRASCRQSHAPPPQEAVNAAQSIMCPPLGMASFQRANTICINTLNFRAGRNIVIHR